MREDHVAGRGATPNPASEDRLQSSAEASEGQAHDPIAAVSAADPPVITDPAIVAAVERASDLDRAWFERRPSRAHRVSAIDRTTDVIELLMPAVAAGSDDLRDTVACGIFWLRDLAEEMPEGELREGLEQLIDRLERNIERELDELPLAIAEALERELVIDLIIRGGRS